MEVAYLHPHLPVAVVCIICSVIQKYQSEWYSVETSEELVQWLSHLQSVTHTVSIEGLDLDNNCSQQLLDDEGIGQEI